MAVGNDKIYDLLIVGGGINGAGIARDAAGRGLSVALVEKGDLASATSSASSKLIHGGLRYLEYYEFRLVHEALSEREVLLKIAPHIVWPLRFVLPHVKSLRPAWMVRLGLVLYDNLSRRVTLPGSTGVDLRQDPFGAGLKPGLAKGFAYSDCWVDDARLVVLNARAAAEAGAAIFTRTRCIAGTRADGLWRLRVRDEDSGDERTLVARALINASGPWARELKKETLHLPTPHGLKLVQGSHIVVPRLHDADHALILQNDDGRVVFVIPFEGAFSLIGTTESVLHAVPGGNGTKQATLPEAPEDEIDYLCRAANLYMERTITPDDVIWSYSGVRPLLAEDVSDPKAITRDYEFELDAAEGEAPALTIIGGKITTYRRLAEKALDKMAPYLKRMGPAWTAETALPGGDLGVAGFDAFLGDLRRDYQELPAGYVATLARRYGSLAREILGDALNPDDLGQGFGATLSAREVDYLVAREWAVTAEDVLWRRTKAGLHMTAQERDALAGFMARTA
jgi:glycerol-3-phosphate dehydrogenase